MTPLRRGTLDVAQCETCRTEGDKKHSHNTQALWLHGRCHPESPTWAFYKDGVVTVTCARCKLLVAEIQVAE